MAIKTRNGTANNDTLTGTTGIDWFYGLDGNDLLRGDKGNDFLSGGNGNDTLEGGIGADTLHGGTGNDTFLYKSIIDAKIDPINSQEQINDFSVGDKIDFSAITTRHFIGNEEFNGIVGEIRYGYSYGYNYGLNAMDNIDVMGMMGMSSKNSASLQMDSDGDAVADIQIAVKQINNTKAINLVETSTNSGAFILATDLVKNGDTSSSSLTGGSGNDTISGLAGNDTLIGFSGRDNLSGGDGNDAIYGGLGSDTLTGNAGIDYFTFTRPEEISYRNDSGDTITDFSNGDQIVISMAGIPLDYIGSASFSGVTAQYRFNGNSITFDFDGDTTTDAVINVNDFSATGSLGESPTVPNRLVFVANKNLVGTSSNESLSGSFTNDTLKGLDGNDTLSGSDGNDTLEGGNGNDIIIGGKGDDKLTGGSGNDIFRYLSDTDLSRYSYDGETITDFTTGDKIDLSGIDANSNIAGNQSFMFIGSNGFNDIAGELRLSYDTLYGDIDGDGYNDIAIDFQNSLTLTTTDFIL